MQQEALLTTTAQDLTVEPTQPLPPPGRIERGGFWQELGLDILAGLAPTIGQSSWVRRRIVRRFEASLTSKLTDGTSRRSAGVTQDRTDMSLSILHTADRLFAEDRIGKPTIDRLMQVLVKEAMIRRGDASVRQQFCAEYGANSPSFMVISPGKACNLHCTGCYASSTSPDKEKLSWDVFDRMVSEMRDLWGSRFVVVSGGEPLVYRDQGKGLLDMAERYRDMFFMFYTNGTLIDEETAQRIGELGNIMPAISVEGMRESTDERRGQGVFDQVVAAMDRLREAQAIYGLSMTATCHNYQELMSDELLDFYFNEHGAAFAWLFHYMPIGRSYTLELMPTPEQRHWLWEKAWEQIRKRQIFIADFWNAGTVVDGCLSAGRAGGYLYTDWNGNVSPCVFVPYSPVNINDVYASGGNLNDAYAAPFFKAIRNWQYHSCGFREGGSKECSNLLTPCIIRDHHADFERLVTQYEPEPIDQAAAEALSDAAYHRGLERFDEELAAVMQPLWETQYVDDGNGHQNSDRQGDGHQGGDHRGGDHRGGL